MKISYKMNVIHHLLLAALAIFLFQNCSQDYQWMDVSESSNASTENYSSSSKENESNLKYVFCDMKRLISGRQGNIDSKNYKKIMNAFKFKLGCNGIRVQIDSKTLRRNIDQVADSSDPESYTEMYRNVFSYARQIGLLIYANTLPEPGVLEYEGDIQIWVNRVGDFTNHFCPNFVGPFNENGKLKNHVEVIRQLRSKINSDCVDPSGLVVKNIKIVGPDSTKIATAINALDRESDLADEVDIVSAHSNGGGFNDADGADDANDRSATKEDWSHFKAWAKKKPIWASEAAVRWSNIVENGENKNKEVGLKAAVHSQVVSGIVIYQAATKLDQQTFELNEIGEEIAKGLSQSGWNIP